MTQELFERHPILDTVAHCLDQMRSLADANPIFLSAPQKAAAIRQALVLESMACELRLRVMAEAGDVVEDSPQRSMGQWLEVNAGVYRSNGARDARLAEALTVYPYVAEAMRGGVMTCDQAGVIVQALGRLPVDLGEDLQAAAEQHLVEQARLFGPHDLRILGEKVLEAVAPDAWEALEAQRLLRQDDQARAGQRLTLKPRGDGLTQISGRIPDVVAIRLATYLDAFTNPRREGSLSVFERPQGLGRMPYPWRAAVAFGQLLEAWDPKRLPVHGGDATTLMVTLDYDQLVKDLSVATLLDAPDTEAEGRIPASEARRLACNARIVPVVLGSESEVLDQGRAVRLFTKAQQRALVLRDRTCRSEGCHVPGTWSEAHHWVHWVDGGLSDLANAVLLCSHHHHLVHDPRWRADRLTNGDVRFVLRT